MPEVINHTTVTLQIFAIRINDTMTYAQELDTAIDLYNEEQYDECIAHINRVYRDRVPLYSSLRYNILLACCLDDWHEAEVRKL